MAELRRLKQSDPGFPDVVLIFRGDEAGGRKFLAAFWPDARAIADPDGSLYDAFGLSAASWRQAFGWPVWKRAAQAALRGHFVGLPGRDPWRMPGVFLVRDGQVIAGYGMRHVGDLPDFAEFARTAA